MRAQIAAGPGGVLVLCALFVLFPLPALNGAPAAKKADVKGEEKPEDFSLFDSSEYKDLPRVSFKLLVEDSEFLKGEKFKGVLYPRRFTRPPWPIVPLLKKGEVVIVARSASGKNSMYILVAEERKKQINRIIASQKRMYFVYTPVSAVGDLPVVRLVDELSPGPTDGKETAVAKTEMFKYFPSVKGGKWTLEVGNRLRLLEYEILETKKNYAKGTKTESIPNAPGPGKLSDFYIYYTRDSITTVEEGYTGTGTQFKQTDIVLKGPLAPGTSWTVKMDDEERRREIVGVHDTVTVGVREYKDVVVVREEAQVRSQDSSYFAVTYYFYAADVGLVGCRIDSADNKENLKNYNELEEWFIQRTE